MRFLRRQLAHPERAKIIAMLTVLGVFGLASSVAAGMFDSLVNNVAGAIFGLFLAILGRVLLVLIDLLLKVASYNSFLDSAAVQIGWKLVRDICNLGFVVGMLMIAFGTVLNIGSYHAKSRLTKLLLMAILINFSKGITGFLIDISQVVMLTFLQALRETAAGNITEGFGLRDMLAVRNSTEDLNFTGILGAYMLASIMVWLAIVLILGLIVKLLYRIVSLWVLVIFSPVAYVASVVPGLSKYSGQWWGKLGDNLTSGPVIAFFLWLAMSIVAVSYKGESEVIVFDGGTDRMVSSEAGKDELAAAASEASSTGAIANYIIMVVFLTMAMQFGSAAGDAGAKAFGTVTSKLNNAAKSAVKGVRDYGIERASEKSGVQLSPSEWIKGWQSNRAFVKDQRRKRTADKGQQRGGVYGHLGSPQDFFKNYANRKAFTGSFVNGKYEAGAFVRGVVPGKAFTTKSAEKIREQADKDKVRLDGMTERYKQATQEQWATQREFLVNQQREQEGVKSNADKNTSAIEEHTTININGAGNEDVLQVINEEIARLQQKKEKEKDPVEKANIEGKITALQTARTTGYYNSADGSQGLNQELTARMAQRRQEAAQKIAALTDQIGKGDNVKDRFANAAERDEFAKKEITPLKDTIKIARARAERMREPEMYYAQQEGRALRNEEMKKIQDVKDSGQLTDMFRDAQALGDVARAEAIVMRLAQDANFNDLLLNTGHDSSAAGMKEFFEVELGETMKVGEQSMLSLAQDVSYLNEDRKHYELSRVVKGRRGKLDWMDQDEHSEAVISQVRKVDLEDLARRGNRQAYGYEDAQTGEFHFSQHGLQLIKENYNEYITLIRGNRFGKNTAQKFNEASAQAELQKLRAKLKPGADQAQFDVFLQELKKFSGKAETDAQGIDPEVASIMQSS